MARLLVNKHTASTDKAVIKELFDKKKDIRDDQGEIIIMNNPAEPGIAILDASGNVVKVGEGTKGGFNCYDNSLEFVKGGMQRDLKIKEDGYRVNISEPQGMQYTNALKLDESTGKSGGLYVPISNESGNSIKITQKGLYVNPIPPEVADLGTKLNIINQKDQEQDSRIQELENATPDFTEVNQKIAKNAQDIATVSGSTTTALSQIEGVNQSVTTVATNLETTNANLNEASSRITSLDESIKTVSENLETTNTNLNTTNSRIDGLSGALDTVSAQVNAANQGVSAANTRIDGVSATLDIVAKQTTAANEGVGAANVKIDTISEQLNRVAGQANTAGDEANRAHSRIDAIDSTISEHTSSISQLQSDVSGLTGLTGSVSANTESIKSLTTKVDKASSDATEANTNAASASAKVVELAKQMAVKVDKVSISSSDENLKVSESGDQAKPIFDLSLKMEDIDNAKPFIPKKPAVPGENPEDPPLEPEVPEQKKVDGLVSALDVKSHLDTINEYKVNEKLVKDNPVLGGVDIRVNDISGNQDTGVSQEDTLNVAFGKQQATFNTLSTCFAAAMNNIHQDLYLDKLVDLGQKGLFPGVLYNLGEISTAFPEMAFNTVEVPNNTISKFKALFDVKMEGLKPNTIPEIKWEKGTEETLVNGDTYLMEVLVRKDASGTTTKLGKLTSWTLA